MSLLGREIFLDSPIQLEYLRIHDACTSKGLGCDRITENTGSFLSAITSSLRLWELANSNSLMGHQLIVKGGRGYSILVFYLTVVCGFKATVKTENGDIGFGNPTSGFHVRVLVDVSDRKGWETGYLSDDLSVRDCVLHAMKPDDSQIWQPGRASFAPPNPVPSPITVWGHGDLDPGEVNLSALHMIDGMVPPMASLFVTRWLSNLVQARLSRTHVVVVKQVDLETRDADRVIHRHRATQRGAMAQRLRSGIQLFAPGFFKAQDLEKLILNVQKGKTCSEPGQLSDALPEDTARLICSESCHKRQPVSFRKRHIPSNGTSQSNAKQQDTEDCQMAGTEMMVDSDEEDISNGPVSEGWEDTSHDEVHILNSREENCMVQELQRSLKSLAFRLLLCTYLELSAQALLRNTIQDNSLPPGTESEMALGSEARDLLDKNPELKVISTRELMHIIAEALSGRKIQEPAREVIAIAAGGAIVGLNTNDTHSIDADPGHCLYVIPGSIDSPKRRIREVSESPQIGQLEEKSKDPGVSLERVQTPLNTFEEAQVNHAILIQGDTAMLRSQIPWGSKNIFLFNLRAIDNANNIEVHRACFKKCARGNLTDMEIGQIRLITSRNFSVGKKTSLLLAHGNTSIQRAVLSQLYLNKVLVQLGQCVHCACRAALLRDNCVIID